MIYADACTWAKGDNPRVTYAHLVADSLEELHDCALKIGLNPCFYHSLAKYKYYDISSKMYHKAIQAGAEVVSSRERY